MPWFKSKLKERIENLEWQVEAARADAQRANDRTEAIAKKLNLQILFGAPYVAQDK